MHGDSLSFISYFSNLGIEDCMSIPILSNLANFGKNGNTFLLFLTWNMSSKVLFSLKAFICGRARKQIKERKNSGVRIGVFLERFVIIINENDSNAIGLIYRKLVCNDWIHRIIG